MVCTSGTWTRESLRALAADGLNSRQLGVVGEQQGRWTGVVIEALSRTIDGLSVLRAPDNHRESRAGYRRMVRLGLWPLCHQAYQRPCFDSRDWQDYRRVNESWAGLVLRQCGGRDGIVLLPGFSLALLPGMLKQRDPSLTLVQFWDVPWPSADLLRVCPWREELLIGLGGSDFIGFSAPEHKMNFLRSVEDCGLPIGDGSRIRVVAPGIDFEEHARLARGIQVPAAAAVWWRETGWVPELVGASVDEVEHINGIQERLEAIRQLFENHPEYLGRLTFVQVCLPSSRSEQPRRTVEAEVEEINRCWAQSAWKPVVAKHGDPGRAALTALHLTADFWVSNSLHDGVNVAAHEYVASRFDGDGALIVSAFPGAAPELTGALVVNPLHTAELAAAMHNALTMAAPERRLRMNRIRSAAARRTVYDWAGNLLAPATRRRDAVLPSHLPGENTCKPQEEA